MKKSKPIEIQIDAKNKKTFTVNELTISDILTLSQNNKFFGGSDVDEKVDEKKVEQSFLTEVQDIFKDTGRIMELSCDFEMEDLKELAPSDVEKVFDGWKEVNETFLNLLEKMGVLQALKQIVEKGLGDFSRTLAI